VNWLINLAGEWFGINRALAAVDGYKTYLAGASMILTGLGTATTGAVGLVNEIIPLHTLADYFGWAKGLSHDTNAGLVAAGVAMMGKGLGDIGNRHAIAKLEENIVANKTP
jgi:hypothetical protein